MMDIKPPYLKKIESLGKIDIWIVDGMYIRGHIDEEFTNFGQHYAFSYIPENEFWIDREAAHDERKFFIEHLLVEHRKMARGMSYDDALAIADRAERRERRRARDLARFTHGGRRLPDGRDVHERLWKNLESGVKVWIDDAIEEPERRIEYHCRHYPDELHDALAKEGWA